MDRKLTPDHTRLRPSSSLTVENELMIRRTPHIGTLDQRVPEPEGRRRERIRHRRIHLHIVSFVVLSVRHQLQVEQSAHLATDHHRHELTVRDVLHHCADNAARLLEQLLVAPVAVHAAQLLGQPIVLAHPHVVHGQQAGLLAAAAVPGADALVGQRVPPAHVLPRITAAKVQLAIAERAHRVGGALGARIDGGRVQVRRDLVGLFAPRQRTVGAQRGRRAQELEAPQTEWRQPRIVVGHTDGQTGGMLEVVRTGVTAARNGAVDASARRCVGRWKRGCEIRY